VAPHKTNNAHFPKPELGYPTTMNGDMGGVDVNTQHNRLKLITT